MFHFFMSNFTVFYLIYYYSEPSELSIRQLMRECKEALKLAVIERQRYILRVKVRV